MPELLFAHRIVSRAPNRKPLFIARFRSKEVRDEVLRVARSRTRRDGSQHAFFVNEDLTVQQREERKQLVADAKRRNETEGAGTWRVVGRRLVKSDSFRTRRAIDHVKPDVKGGSRVSSSSAVTPSPPNSALRVGNEAALP